MRPAANYWIEKLQLTSHVEGGSFREVYRSSLMILKNNLPATFNGNRNFSTSIYFLLEKNKFSAFHKIASDELWHFYFGDTVIIYEIDVLTGKLTEHKLGNNPERGEVFQTLIKAGNWFASSVVNESEYALVGCTVSPGFDFEDFELAERKTLIKKYPQHADLITMLTR
jgi:uncharacterized protein